MGLTGFDSKPRWYVSMRSDGCGLHNHVGQKKLAKQSTLSLPNRSIVDYWLYRLTR